MNELSFNIIITILNFFLTMSLIYTNIRINELKKLIEVHICYLKEKINNIEKNIKEG